MQQDATIAFFIRNGFTLHVSGDMLAIVSNIIVITDFVNLQYTCLPEAIYSICTPDNGWNCHPKHVE